MTTATKTKKTRTKAERSAAAKKAAATRKRNAAAKKKADALAALPDADDATKKMFDNLIANGPTLIDDDGKASKSATASKAKRTRSSATKKGNASKSAAKSKATPAAKSGDQPAKKRSMTDAAATILAAFKPSDERKGMTTSEIVDEAKRRRLWTTDAKTPAQTLYSAIFREIKVKGDRSRFVKVDKGLFAINPKADA